MKKAVLTAVSLLMLLSFAVQSVAVSVDGFDNGAEWDGAAVLLLENGNSNCKVTFASVKYKVANSENAVYLCFMFTDPDAVEFNPSAGVILNVGGDSFSVIMENSPCADDSSEYSFDAAITADSNYGMTCEIRLGVKAGVPKSLDLCARFVDTDGELSSYYDFTVENPDYIEPQNDNVQYVNPNYAHEYEYTEKTTKAKKTTTTKVTTKKQTTKKRKETTTEKAKTTVPKTTKTRTTKVPATKKAKTVAAKKSEEPATVYYYEKEIILSEVVVTVPQVETTGARVLPSGDLRSKLVLALLGFLLMLIIAAAGAFGARKDSPPKPETEEKGDKPTDKTDE